MLWMTGMPILHNTDIFPLLSVFYTSLRIGAFFFMTLNLVFINISAVDLFIKQKALFMWELSSATTNTSHVPLTVVATFSQPWKCQWILPSVSVLLCASPNRPDSQEDHSNLFIFCDCLLYDWWVIKYVGLLCVTYTVPVGCALLQLNSIQYPQLF